jgi:hypothetical protein
MAEIQLFGRAREKPPEQYTATITLSTLHFADLGPVLDAIEAVVRVAPNVTGKVDGGEQYTRTFYGWDKMPEEWK